MEFVDTREPRSVDQELVGLGDVVLTRMRRETDPVAFLIIRTHAGMYMALNMVTSEPIQGIYESPKDVVIAMRHNFGTVIEIIRKDQVHLTIKEKERA